MKISYLSRHIERLAFLLLLKQSSDHSQTTLFRDVDVLRLNDPYKNPLFGDWEDCSVADLREDLGSGPSTQSSSQLHVPLVPESNTLLWASGTHTVYKHTDYTHKIKSPVLPPTFIVYLHLEATPSTKGFKSGTQMASENILEVIHVKPPISAKFNKVWNRELGTEATGSVKRGKTLRNIIQ